MEEMREAAGTLKVRKKWTEKMTVQKESCIMRGKKGESRGITGTPFVSMMKISLPFRLRQRA